MTVPDDTERETTSDNALPDEARESIKMQALLAEIGSRMGMQIWIPQADRAVVLGERHSNQSPVLERLPLNYDDTTLRTIERISTWLTEQQCPIVALESTGVYWRLVYHVLTGTVEVFVGHAQEMRRRPGHQTDKADARWIAELLAHGLMRPSFMPPPPISALRDLTRTQGALIQSWAQAKNRVVKGREDAHIKLTSVVSDLFGRRGRRMLAALFTGERDPKTLAVLALGTLRRKGVGSSQEPGCAGEQVCHIQLRSVAWIPHDPGHLKTSGHEERVRLRTASMGMEALHPSVSHGSALCAIPGKVLITRSRPMRVNVSLVCHTPPP